MPRPSAPIFATVAAAAWLAGCSAVKVTADGTLPDPLIEPVPQPIGVRYSAEFAGFEFREKRYGTEYHVTLGPAQVASLDRLLGSMFASVQRVEAPADAARLTPPPPLVIEPAFEEFSFVTPRDVAGNSYAVTIVYRVAVYDPQGRQVDSLRFSGFGAAPDSALGAATGPLLLATRRAMRDAGAKFAVEFSEQESVAKLLRGEAVAPIKSAEQETVDAVRPFTATEDGHATPPTTPPQAPPPPAAGPPSPPPT